MAANAFTEAEWDELVANEVEAAKEQRRRVRGDEDFVMSVKMVGPSGEVFTTPFTWSNNG